MVTLKKSNFNGCLTVRGNAASFSLGATRYRSPTKLGKGNVQSCLLICSGEESPLYTRDLMMFSPSDLRQWDFAISHRGRFMSRHSKGDTAAPFGNFNLQLPNHSPYEGTPSEMLQGFTTKSRSFPLHKLVSSNKPPRYASAASWRATGPLVPLQLYRALPSSLLDNSNLFNLVLTVQGTSLYTD